MPRHAMAIGYWHGQDNALDVFDMVRINKVYTRTGDTGTTRLGDGSKRDKHDIRIEAGGAIDELNAQAGLAMVVAQSASPGAETLRLHLRTIQNDLFDLGADVTVPGDGQDKDAPTVLRITQAQIDQLERWIDTATAELNPLTSFILPGGTALAAHLHLCRTVARRAERRVTELRASEPEAVNPRALIYLNRLSDYFFVVAREANAHGKDDILWRPGGR